MTIVAIVTFVAIKTVMAIVIALAIKIVNRHSFFSIFSDLNRVSNIKNAFQDSKELQSSKWRPSKLSLVFWNVSVGLGTVSYIVSPLKTVVAGDLAQYFAGANKGAGRIDTGDWGRNKASSSLLVAVSPLFLLPSFLIGGFTTFGMVKRSRFLRLDLGFFNPKVFHWAARGTSFDNSGACWPETSRIVVIHLSIDGARPEWGFTLGFHNFLYQLFETPSVAGLDVVVRPGWKIEALLGSTWVL